MIVVITPENFRSELLDASMQKTVAVYFYAEALPECLPVTQQLEQLIGPQNAQLTLAKVEVSNPQLQSLAIQLGLQALPAVVLFQQGRPTDARMGMEQLGDLANWLAPLLPKEEDLLREQALTAMEADDLPTALDAIQQARQLQPARGDLLKLHVELCIRLQRLSQARTLLEQITMVDQDAEYQRLVSSLELAEQAAESPELKALEQQWQQSPDDITIAEALAVQYSQAGRKQEALELLFPLLKRDLQAGDVKKIYLDILATMEGDPSASRFRRQLYSLLY